MGIVDDLDRAREAYERREWLSAYHALSDLDDVQLQAEDSAALAVTAYLLGRRNDCVQAMQRSFQAHLDAADERGAARAASWLALLLCLGGEAAVAGGWAARADRLLAGLGDVPERGFALIHEAYRQLFTGDLATAAETAADIAGYGDRFGEPDLLAQGLSMRGRLMAHTGEVQAGLRVLDEAMIGVLAGEVSPIISGIVYCTLIEACVLVSDYARMTEWTRALSSWCDAQPGLVAFTGQCAVHRGQMLRLHGAFHSAVDELQRAVDRYERSGGDDAVGLAHRERGDVLLVLGEHDLAEEAYDAAARSGCSAQPGRAALWLARGEVSHAAMALRTLLSEVGDPVERSRLLPVAVEAAVAGGRIDEAAGWADELGEIATSFGSTALRAAADAVGARVLLERGEPEPAVAAARNAVERWFGLSVPYEAARCRTLLARALKALGDRKTAAVELAVAKADFATLGARTAEFEVDRLLGDAPVPGDLSPRELEVLRLVATGKTNAEIAGELFVAEKTVARHLSNIFNKLDVGSRTAAAAFAFEHRLL